MLVLLPRVTFRFTYHTQRSDSPCSTSGLRGSHLVETDSCEEPSPSEQIHQETCLEWNKHGVTPNYRRIQKQISEDTSHNKVKLWSAGKQEMTELTVQTLITAVLQRWAIRSCRIINNNNRMPLLSLCTWRDEEILTAGAECHVS